MERSDACQTSVIYLTDCNIVIVFDLKSTLRFGKSFNKTRESNETCQAKIMLIYF